jgi:hypothetical protein
MKVFYLLIIFVVFASGCGVISSKAQIRTNANRTVSGSRANQNTKTKTLDISTIDFKNFTFPFPGGGKAGNTLTLKNGISGKKEGSPGYSLRKTYYFDMTGDQKVEAVSHIMVDGCQLGCESSQLFYIYTVENDKLKLLWKIAVGGDTMGGLKAVNFKAHEIILETFGEGTLEDWLIRSNIDLKKNPTLKTSNYTRFVFSGGETDFTQTGKEILPLTTFIDFVEYRPQITFGEPK